MGKSGFSLLQPGTVYKKCFRTVLLYFEESWTLTSQSTQRLQSRGRTEIKMTCWVTLTDRQPSKTLAVRPCLGNKIAQEIECRQLPWYGHVVRRKAQHPIKRVYQLEVQGLKTPGRQKNTWTENIHDLLRRRRPKRSLPMIENSGAR